MNVLICDDDQYIRKMLEKITSKNIRDKGRFFVTYAIFWYNNLGRKEGDKW